MAKRQYEVWQGNNIILLKGRLIFGPDARSVILTVLLIVAPVVVFCIFVGRNLLHKFSYISGLVILSVAISLTIVVLFFLFMTAAFDPGFRKRAPHPPLNDNLYHTPVPSPSNENQCAPMTPRRVPRTLELRAEDGSYSLKLKYCETCMIYRPPRCSHCSLCNNCVDRFDHHCPWIGQCIGQRNYRAFIGFISCGTLLCIYVLSMCVLNMDFVLKEVKWMVLKAMKQSPASTALIIYCFVSLWFIGGLTTFHLYLISTNQTSYEHYKRKHNKPLSWEPNINIFNKGCLINFKELLCTKPNPSEIDLRSFVEEYSPLRISSAGIQSWREVPPHQEESCMIVEGGNTERSATSRPELDEEMGMSTSNWGHESIEAGHNYQEKELAITIAGDTENLGGNRDLQPKNIEPINGL
ncbi:DHHC-type zinc finger family protein [Rhynchospora pubera]|uniref:S-acyltransferase n=1 Tax=Rhynchospora pubera TaxID=906938 RepID=A0AAV8DSL9_9POAL|nr:DHHC-type zinc finger family protein [Rhynchospora pubera]